MLLQHIEVFKTKTYGRMLVLDGVIQVGALLRSPHSRPAMAAPSERRGLVQATERDEFAYQEMMVHPVICCHPAPRDVRAALPLP